MNKPLTELLLDQRIAANAIAARVANGQEAWQVDIDRYLEAEKQIDALLNNTTREVSE